MPRPRLAALLMCWCCSSGVSIQLKVEKTEASRIHSFLAVDDDGTAGDTARLDSFAAAVASSNGSGAGSAFPLQGGPGILEIKCPFNGGSPQTARPPAKPQWWVLLLVHVSWPHVLRC